MTFKKILHVPGWMFYLFANVFNYNYFAVLVIGVKVLSIELHFLEISQIESLPAKGAALN